MSIHSSLRGGQNLKGQRSVYTRVERLAILKKSGKFKEEDGSVWGLPKVRTRYKVATVKKVKAEAAPAAGGTVAATPAAPAAPAAAAAPAKKGGEKKGGEKKK
jgi:small basic protein (TIGR04137 family)